MAGRITLLAKPGSDVMESETPASNTGLYILLKSLDSDNGRAAEKYCHLLSSLISFCEQRTRYSHYADDIVIRALEIVASKLRGGKEIQNLYAYSLGVTKNVVNDFNKMRLPFYLDPTMMSAVKCNRQQIEIERIENEIAEECRQSCMESLPDKERALILRYYQNGLYCKHHRESIAKELGISLEALSNRVARIKKKLSFSCRSCVEKLRAERLPAMLQEFKI